MDRNTYRMTGLCRWRGCLPVILPILVLTFSCSRPGSDVPSEDSTQNNPIPFHSQGDSSDNDGVQHSSAGQAQTAEPPFQNAQVVPAGTLLIVSLKTPLVATSGSRQAFEGVLTEPVVIDGNTLIPQDTIISGLIESAHFSKATPHRDYVRLGLNSVQIDGLSIPIQTASLFARQRLSAEANSHAIRLEKGRRLIFRLNEPVFFHPSTAKASQ